MSRATIEREIDTVLQSRVEQHFAAARQEALAADGDVVTSRHYPIPQRSHCPSVGGGRVCALPLPNYSAIGRPNFETPTIIIRKRKHFRRRSPLTQFPRQKFGAESGLIGISRSLRDNLFGRLNTAMSGLDRVNSHHGKTMTFWW